MVLKNCDYVIIFMFDFVSNRNTMLYKMLFTVDLSYIQNIKQLVNIEQTTDCMTSLFSRLCDRFDALTDDPLSVVCTWPKVRMVDGVESIQK
jgi:hypothetical protein